MNFGFTSDQTDLRDGLRDLLASVCPPDVVRSAWEVRREPLLSLWKQFGEVGLLGLLAPEERGGMGGTEVDLVLLLEECGRFAVPGPIGEHLAVAVPALVAADGDALSRALDGGLVATAQECPVATVRWAGDSNLVVCLSDDQLRWAYAADLAFGVEQASVDRSVPVSELIGQTATVPSSYDPAQARRRAALAAAAQLLGLADRMITMTADYTKTREQFGKPIGSQQAVKHLTARALVALEHARPVVYRAGWVLASGSEAPDLAVSFAKVYAARAAELAARTALQCHGAIGYTWEHDLHLWMKRVWVLAAAWGTTAEHENAVAAAVLDAS